MLVVGAAATVGSIAGAAAGAAFAKTQYEKIVSKLEEQKEHMSKNFDEKVKAIEEKSSSEKKELKEEITSLREENAKLMKKFEKSEGELANLTAEVSQAKEEAKKEAEEVKKEAEKKHQELMNKMEQDKNEMRLQQNMILSFLNIHPALQPPGPSHSGTQTVTEGLSGALGTTGTQGGLHGANMSTSQFSIVADFSDEDTEVVPDPQNPGPYINWLTALNYSKNHQVSNVAAEFSDDDIEVIPDPNSQVDQPTTSGHSKNPNII